MRAWETMLLEARGSGGKEGKYLCYCVPILSGNNCIVNALRMKLTELYIK